MIEIRGEALWEGGGRNIGNVTVGVIDTSVITGSWSGQYDTSDSQRRKLIRRNNR